jgi:hypothetical protein
MTKHFSDLRVLRVLRGDGSFSSAASRRRRANMQSYSYEEFGYS